MSYRFSGRIWLTTWFVLSLGFMAFGCFYGIDGLLIGLVASLAAFIGALPALVMMILVFELIEKQQVPFRYRIKLLNAGSLLISLCYGALGALLYFNKLSMYLGALFTIAGVLYTCFLISFVYHYKGVVEYLYDYTVQVSSFSFPRNLNLLSLALFTGYFKIHSITYITNNQMTQSPLLPENANETNDKPTSNKVLVKAAITGILILVMMIPTIFISNLITEREQRQKQVVAEVSSKWASAQTLTGPYIVVPYNETGIGSDKRQYSVKKSVVLLPEELAVTGKLYPEKRERSIFTVLLYKTKLHAKGNFKLNIPASVDPTKLLLSEAKICVGLNDFKGIEEKVTLNFNGSPYDLTPGLPSTEIDSVGLSSSITITAEDLKKLMPFEFDLKIKGSEQLNFVPLSGNSSFELQSVWPNPSFNGSALPSERQLSEKGFTAKWSFNKANLPFDTFLKDFKLDKSAYVFGVSMVQPADQYAKTMRCVKYAILFIGLTFSLFFFVELMQKRPVHPVQYVMVGLALVIFYSLLLSVSEFIMFDHAYLIAASATVILITLYAKGHFRTWKVAGVFALVMSMLYSFIFVLIRLEDTALLVGSIGLFAVLALVMYASRRVNWYNPNFGKAALQA